MPQLQFLERQPSFGSQLGKALGEGVGTGIQAQLKEFHEQKQKKEKSLGKLQPTFNLFSKEFGRGDFPEEDKEKVMDRSRDLVSEGYDPYEAVQQSWKEFDTKQGVGVEETEEFTDGDSTFGAQDLLGLLGRAPELVDFLKQKEIEEGPNRFQSLMSAPLKGVIEGGNINPLQQLTQAVSPQLTQRILESQFPTQDKPAERMLQTAGRIAPIAATGGGGAPLIAAELGAAAGAREGVKQLGGGELAQGAAELAGFSLPSLGKFAWNKIGSILNKNIPIKKPPSLKEIGISKKDSPSAFSGPFDEAQASESYKDVFSNASKRLEEKGVSMEAVKDGDPQAVKAFQNQINKSSKQFSDAQKLNVKEFNKQQSKLEKRLSKSPLEKYYGPKKEVSQSLERQAIEAERNVKLDQFINEKAQEAQRLQASILGRDSALRAGSLTPQQNEFIRASRKIETLNHTKAMDAIQNARFEQRYGRPPATSEQIGKQIEDTFAKLKEGIKKPDVKKVEQFRKGFERDKNLIKEAQDLAKSGDIPGPEVMDEYIKIHKQYVKAYDDLAGELTDFVSSNSGLKGKGAQVDRAKDLLKIVKNNQKTGKAKIKLQEDKRKALRHLDKPTGAFLKTNLKNAGREIEAFEKDFFKWQKIATGEDIKASQIAKKSLEKEKAPFQRKTQEAKAPPKVEGKFKREEFNKGFKEGEKAYKDPSSSTRKTAAERAGMSEEEYAEYLKDVRSSTDGLKDALKSGKGTQKAEEELSKSILKKFKSLPRPLKALTFGTLIGTAQSAIEEATGKSIPQKYLWGALTISGRSKGLGTRVGAGPIASIISDGIRRGSNHVKANKLRSIRRNRTASNNYLRELNKKFGTARTNKIKKLAFDS